MTQNALSRRRFLRTGLMAAGLALAGPVIACTQAADTTLSRAQRRGFIRIGFADEPPYGYVTETGDLTGVGPDLARHVFRQLDVAEIDGVLSPFGSLIERLNDGRFDVIAAGMFITPGRCQRVIFSDPYFCIEQALLVRRGNPHRLHRYEDFANDTSLRLGVVIGTVEVDQAVAAGISETQTVRVDSPADLLEALRANRVDAGALSTVSLTNLAARGPLDGFEVTPSFPYRGQSGCGAFAFRKDDTALRDEFNRAFRLLRDEGTVADSARPFGFLEATEAANGQTTQALCER